MVAKSDHKCKSNHQVTDLTDWIGKVKVKLQRQKRNNLRMAVMLSNTLNAAQSELRRKQTERKSKWIDFKMKALVAVDNGGSVDMNHERLSCIIKQSNNNDENNDDLEELLKLDKFMLQLKSVKRHLIR